MMVLVQVDCRLVREIRKDVTTHIVDVDDVEGRTHRFLVPETLYDVETSRFTGWAVDDNESSVQIQLPTSSDDGTGKVWVSNTTVYCFE